MPSATGRTPRALVPVILAGSLTVDWRCPRPARGRPLDYELATKLVFQLPASALRSLSKTTKRQFFNELTFLFF